MPPAMLGTTMPQTMPPAGGPVNARHDNALDNAAGWRPHQCSAIQCNPIQYNDGPQCDACALYTEDMLVRSSGSAAGDSGPFHDLSY